MERISTAVLTVPVDECGGFGQCIAFSGTGIGIALTPCFCGTLWVFDPCCLGKTSIGSRPQVTIIRPTFPRRKKLSSAVFQSPFPWCSAEVRSLIGLRWRGSEVMVNDQPQFLPLSVHTPPRATGPWCQRSTGNPSSPKRSIRKRI